MVPEARAVPAYAEFGRTDRLYCFERNGCKFCVRQSGGQFTRIPDLSCLKPGPGAAPVQESPLESREFFRSPFADERGSWNPFLPGMNSIAYGLTYALSWQSYTADANRAFEAELSFFHQHLKQEQERLAGEALEARGEWQRSQPSALSSIRELRKDLRSLSESAGRAAREVQEKASRAKAEAGAVPQKLLTGGAPIAPPAVPSALERERARWGSLPPGPRREAGLELLEQAKRFEANPGSRARGIADALIEEARSLRYHDQGYAQGAAPELQLAERVARFERHSSWLEARREEIRGKLESGGEFKSDRGTVETASRIAGELNAEAKSSFYSGSLAEGEGHVTLGHRVLDVALGFVPGVSVGKDAYELLTGRNLVTGEKLTSLDLAVCALGVVTLGGSDLVTGSAKAILRVATRAGSRLDEAREAIVGGISLARNPAFRGALASLGDRVTSASRAYLAAAAESGLRLSETDLIRIGERFADLETRIATLPGRELRETVWRGRYWNEPGNPADAAGEVFKWGVEGLRTRNHRFSIGGKYGQDALYGAIGTREEAFQTVLAELRADDVRNSGAALLFASREFQLSKVLDLREATSPGIFELLKVRPGELRETYEQLGPRAYEVSQQLGFLAKRHGFDGIVVESAQNPGFYNLVLLKEGS